MNDLHFRLFFWIVFCSFRFLSFHLLSVQSFGSPCFAPHRLDGPLCHRIPPIVRLAFDWNFGWIRFSARNFLIFGLGTKILIKNSCLVNIKLIIKSRGKQGNMISLWFANLKSANFESATSESANLNLQSSACWFVGELIFVSINPLVSRASEKRISTSGISRVT